MTKKRKRGKGWHGDPEGHSLAARGIPTKKIRPVRPPRRPTPETKKGGSRVITALTLFGPMTRKEISKKTGMRLGKVEYVLRLLRDQGIVHYSSHIWNLERKRKRST